MSSGHHPSRRAQKSHRCQGLPIIQRCRNNVDFHLSCVRTRPPSCKEPLKRDEAYFWEEGPKSFGAKVNFVIKIKLLFSMEMDAGWRRPWLHCKEREKKKSGIPILDTRQCNKTKNRIFDWRPSPPHFREKRDIRESSQRGRKYKREIIVCLGLWR